jgi:hypothetical protein
LPCGVVRGTRLASPVGSASRHFSARRWPAAGAAPPWVKMAAVSAPMAVRGRTLYFSWSVVPSIASFRGIMPVGGKKEFERRCGQMTRMHADLCLSLSSRADPQDCDGQVPKSVICVNLCHLPASAFKFFLTPTDTGSAVVLMNDSASRLLPAIGVLQGARGGTPPAGPGPHRHGRKWPRCLSPWR